MSLENVEIVNIDAKNAYTLNQSKQRNWGAGTQRNT